MSIVLTINFNEMLLDQVVEILTKFLISFTGLPNHSENCHVGHFFIINACFWFSNTLGTNPYLTFHCAGQGTVLIDLAPDDKEFQSVEEEVLYLIPLPYLHNYPSVTYETHYPSIKTMSRNWMENNIAFILVRVLWISVS